MSLPHIAVAYNCPSDAPISKQWHMTASAVCPRPLSGLLRRRQRHLSASHRTVGRCFWCSHPCVLRVLLLLMLVFERSLIIMDHLQQW